MLLEFSTIVNAIGSIGFPIVLCIMMFRYVSEDGKKRNDLFVEMTKAVNNNTLAIQQLADKMDIDIAEELHYEYNNTEKM